MKSLVLHVGIPKTGSSALQVFWAQNRKALLLQSLDYFELGDFVLGARGKISSGNGAHLARSFLRPQAAGYRADREEQFAALDREIATSSCDIGLLSSEIFIFADDAALAEFARWLGARGISLRFFYFIRDQVQFLTSSYIQQVKRHACTETSEQYIQRVYDKISHIRYSKLFDRLARIASPEQIVCRSYQDARASKHGICDLFLDSFGLEPEGLTFADASVNVSLDMTELKIMLALNKLKPRMVFSDLLVENAARRGRKTSDLAHQLLSRESLERIERYFSEDNARFARSYFGRDSLFEPRDPTAEAQQHGDAEPGLSEVMEVFGGLLVRFDERLAALERRVKSASLSESTESGDAVSVASRRATGCSEREEAGGAVG
jgi:hypothetical protein